MNKEKFKKELEEIEISSYNWQNRMMMAAKLFKAFGYSLKDIEENSEITHVFLPISGILDKMVHPNDEFFYKYVLIKNESNDINSINERLNDKRIKRIFFKDVSQIKSKYDINEEEGKEDFFEDVYINSRVTIMRKLISTDNFPKKIVDFITKKYGMSYLQEFKKRLKGGYNEIANELYEYVMEESDGKELLAKACVMSFKEIEKDKKQELKQGLTNRIKATLDLFYKTGYLEDICKINNSIMTELGIPSMMLSMNENKDTFNITSILDNAYFNQFELEELFVFSAFYTNRLEKIIENVNEGIFLHYKLGTFYDTVAYGEIPKNIDSNDVRTILRQRAFIQKLTKEEFMAFKLDSEFFDMGKVPEEFIKKYKDVYEDYYERYTLGSENNFEKDYAFVFCSRGVEACMYVLKDFSMESLIYTLSQYKSKINFGLIKEDRVTVNDLGEEQVLIGIDMKDLQTVRLHFPKKDFDIFKEKFFSDGGFPEYLGNEDFSFTKENGEKVDVKTHMLYKFNKKQRQAIKKQMEELKTKDPDSDLYKFLRHIYENMHPSQNPLNTKKKDRKVNKNNNDGEIE